jgi:hypothetical protein
VGLNIILPIYGSDNWVLVHQHHKVEVQLYLHPLVMVSKFDPRVDLLIKYTGHSGDGGALCKIRIHVLEHHISVYKAAHNLKQLFYYFLKYELFLSGTCVKQLRSGFAFRIVSQTVTA